MVINIADFKKTKEQQKVDNFGKPIIERTEIKQPIKSDEINIVIKKRNDQPEPPKAA